MLDLTLAVRRLRRSPGFTLAAIGTLSLGMSAATALFSIAHGVLIKPLPYRDPERLVALPTTDPNGGIEISAPMFWDLQTGAKSLQGVAIQRYRGFELNTPGRPERIPGMEVSAGYFELLGYRPSVGRFFQRADEDTQRTSVVLGYGLWMRAFGGDPAVVGRSIRLDRRSAVILGVAPKEMELPWNDRADVFVPVDRRDADTAERLNYNYFALGRLKTGVGLEAARSEMAAIFRGWLEKYPETPREVALTARSLQPFLLGSGFRPVALLLVAVCLLLLITCTNVAGLFLARAIGRSRDTALRIALGAGREHLFRQSLSDGLCVGLGGGLLSVPLAGLAVKLVPLWLPGAGTLNGASRVSLDTGVLLFTLLLGLAVSIFLAMIPMVQIRSLHLQQALGNRSWGPGARAAGLRTALVGGQVALATVLLVSSGLLFRSITKVLSTDPGFELEHVVAFAVRLPADRYAAEADRTRFEDELVARLRGIPGVDTVGTSHLLPFGGEEGSTSFRVLDGRDESGAPRDGIAADIVGADYFRTLGISILKGRPLLETDTLQAPRVVVVNEAFVHRHLRGEPIGQRLSGGWRSEATPKGTPLEIVGVAADFRNASLDVAPVPRVMYAAAQMPYFGKSFLLHTSHSAGALRALVQERVAVQDPDLPVLAYGSLEDRATRGVGSRRRTAVILGTFAGLALLLSGVGIYGVVSYLVAHRTREFGIRKALGAEGVHILGAVLGEGARMVLVGAVLGVAGALAAGRLLASQLYGISPNDPEAIAVSILALGATCLLASLLPALRAAAVDPVVALREE